MNLPECKIVATKLETHEFNCFHVDFEDSKRLKELPVGTALVTLSDANAAIQAAYEHGKRDAVPEGWKLVPEHPTQDMVEAISPLLQHPAVGMYKAMLAAAPIPSVKEEEK